MKVSGTSGVGSTGGPGKARPVAGGAGFSLPAASSASGTSQTAPTSGVSMVSSVDALIALQDVGGPLERRRRSVRRAGRILDVLDDMKTALLDDGLGPQDLERLRRAVRDERLGTDDATLEGVLDEIETRAAVEIAKLEQASRAA
jgi:hypothetical protein